MEAIEFSREIDTNDDRFNLEDKLPNKPIFVFLECRQMSIKSGIETKTTRNQQSSEMK